MKLKNKKTGEIKDTEKGILFGDTAYNSLAELCEEMEDYKEPKEYWYIDYLPNDNEITIHFEDTEDCRDFYNKLLAWQRLKDKGFRFEWWKEASGFLDYNKIAFNTFAYIADDKDPVSQDLDLLFGGEK